MRRLAAVLVLSLAMLCGWCLVTVDGDNISVDGVGLEIGPKTRGDLRLLKSFVFGQ